MPILFRPLLHEAEGGWFWWGAKGPGPCLALYHHLYHRLVDYHHIDNLLWVWNSANPDWYPGDDEVDIMAVDAYPEDPRDSLEGTWEPLLKRFDGKKMLALAEIGGVPDVERNFRLGVRWAYFVSWGGEFAGANLPTPELRRRYLNPKAVVLKAFRALRHQRTQRDRLRLSIDGNLLKTRRPCAARADKRKPKCAYASRNP